MAASSKEVFAIAGVQFTRNTEEEEETELCCWQVRSKNKTGCSIFLIKCHLVLFSFNFNSSFEIPPLNMLVESVVVQELQILLGLCTFCVFHTILGNDLYTGWF